MPLNEGHRVKTQILGLRDLSECGLRSKSMPARTMWRNKEKQAGVNISQIKERQGFEEWPLKSGRGPVWLCSTHHPSYLTSSLLVGYQHLHFREERLRLERLRGHRLGKEQAWVLTLDVSELRTSLGLHFHLGFHGKLASPRPLARAGGVAQPRECLLAGSLPLEHGINQVG